MKYRNIFSQAAFIKRAKDKAREKNYNLKDAAKELAKEIMLAYALYYGLWLAAIVALLVILAFTELLGGPFVVAQIVLFLVVGTLLLLAVGLWWLWRRIKQAIRRVNESLHRRHARDATATEDGATAGGVITDADETAS